MSVVVMEEAALRAMVREECNRAVQAALDARPRDGGTRGDVGDDQLLTRAEVAALLAVAPRELRRLVLEGAFPPPIDLGPRRIRWRRRTVEAWISKAEKKALDALRAGCLHVAGMNTAAHTGDPA